MRLPVCEQAVHRLCIIKRQPTENCFAVADHRGHHLARELRDQLCPLSFSFRRREDITSPPYSNFDSFDENNKMLIAIINDKGEELILLFTKVTILELGFIWRDRVYDESWTEERRVANYFPIGERRRRRGSQTGAGAHPRQFRILDSCPATR